MASSLYSWACQKGDGLACHSLGELERQQSEKGKRWRASAAFARSCEAGELVGCHDQVLLALEDLGAEEQAARVFELLCAEGLLPACTNFANLLARGVGVAEKDHGRALDLSRSGCEMAKDWQNHPLAPLAPGAREEKPELFWVSEFDAEVPCRQLEALAIEVYEARLRAAFAAERPGLMSCFCCREAGAYELL